MQIFFGVPVENRVPQADGAPEVCEHQAVVPVDEEVVGLDVPVHVPHHVQLLYAPQDLVREEGCTLLRQEGLPGGGGPRKLQGRLQGEEVEEVAVGEQVQQVEEAALRLEGGVREGQVARLDLRRVGGVPIGGRVVVEGAHEDVPLDLEGAPLAPLPHVPLLDDLQGEPVPQVPLPVVELAEKFGVRVFFHKEDLPLRSTRYLLQEYEV